MEYKNGLVLILLVLLLISITGCSKIFCDKYTYHNVTKTIYTNYSRCDVANSIHCYNGVDVKQFIETTNTSEKVLCSLVYPE